MAWTCYTDAKARFLEAFERHILKPRGMDHRVMFTGPTGANAVEAAMKLARKVTGRTNIIAFTNGFHGVTPGRAGGDRQRLSTAAAPALTCTACTRAALRRLFRPTASTPPRCWSRCSTIPRAAIDAPAAIMLETVQGEGGLNAASADWLQRIAAARPQPWRAADHRRHSGRLRPDGHLLLVRGDGRCRPTSSPLAKSLSGFGLPLARGADHARA